MKYKLLGVIFFLLIGSLGFYSALKTNPYALDYSKLTINLPITHKRHIEQNIPVGEVYLAKDLAKEFNKFGFEAKVYTLEDSYSNQNYKNGIEFFMRGWPELSDADYIKKVENDKIKVLLETYPFDDFILEKTDLVFTGSLKKDKKLKEKGINSYFLPQFVFKDKFYYSPKEELKTKILFVGNVWTGGVNRKSVEYALKNNIKIDIYGSGWTEFLPPEKLYMYKAKQIKNEDLKYYYSSADIVLNDTRKDMIDSGFISNRIFDVTACKGFVISDYVPEIEEIYGDSVPMYKTEQEFVELINYYLAHPDERIKKANKAYEITMKNFTADIVVKKMSDEIKKLVAKKREDNGIK